MGKLNLDDAIKLAESYYKADIADNIKFALIIDGSTFEFSSTFGAFSLVKQDVTEFAIYTLECTFITKPTFSLPGRNFEVLSLMLQIQITDEGIVEIYVKSKVKVKVNGLTGFHTPRI